MHERARKCYGLLDVTAQGVDEGAVPNFETFTRRMIPLSKDPFVTIQRRGTISMSASAHQLLGSPKSIELLYDATERIVGFRGVDEASEHSYPVRSVSNRTEGPFVFSGTAFAKHYGIDTSQSRRRKAQLVDGVLCIDLKDPGTVVTGNRGPSRRRDPDTTGAAANAPAAANDAVAHDAGRDGAGSDGAAGPRPA